MNTQVIKNEIYTAFALIMHLTEGLAESVVGAEGAPRAFILKLGYFGSIL